MGVICMCNISLFHTLTIIKNYSNRNVHVHVSLIHLQVFFDSNLLNTKVQTDTRSFCLAK